MAALLASAPAASAKERSAGAAQHPFVLNDFFGLVLEDAFAQEGPPRTEILAAAARTGAGTIRQSFDWERIEISPGVYDFSYYDRYVAAVSENRFRLLPILFNPPGFRSARPPGDSHPGTFPPYDNADLADFAAALVNRYGPSGSFWRERPDLAGYAIRRWQIWNEPNLPSFWASGPDPRAYTAMVRAARDAIKAADPTAEVVSAGLAASREGRAAESFLKGMYAAGARSSFDTLGVHMYARDSRRGIRILERLQRVMRRYGDRKPVWVTEFGWASGGPSSVYTVGFRKQAALIAQTLRRVVGARRRLGIRGIVYYNWRDTPPDSDGNHQWWHHTGLLRLDGQEKPALSAFSTTIRRHTVVTSSRLHGPSLTR